MLESQYAYNPKIGTSGKFGANASSMILGWSAHNQYRTMYADDYLSNQTAQEKSLTNPYLTPGHNLHACHGDCTHKCETNNSCGQKKQCENSQGKDQSACQANSTLATAGERAIKGPEEDLIKTTHSRYCDSTYFAPSQSWPKAPKTTYVANYPNPSVYLPPYAESLKGDKDLPESMYQLPSGFSNNNLEFEGRGTFIRARVPEQLDSRL